MLLSCGKQSNTLTTEMVSATFLQLIRCIGDEHDPSFLSSVIKSFSDSLLVVTGSTSNTSGGAGGAHTIGAGPVLGENDWRLPAEYHNGVIEATKRQLQIIADRRRARANANASGLAEEEDKEDLALYEEMEDFALEEMSRMVRVLDAHTQSQMQASPNSEIEQQLRQWHDQHEQMLVAVSSVRDLGISRYDESDEDGDV